MRLPLAAIVVALAGSASAQPPPAAALEEALVQAVARAEGSLVAVARVRREGRGELLHVELRPDPFGRRPAAAAPLPPTDPAFVPNEYASGVVVDRRGLVLTAAHVLEPDCDYYVTTRDHKVYRAEIRGADPRSDLAVLAIEAEDLEPIAFAEPLELRKGQLVVALGNPHALARDGQASASWGIVSNLGRKSPPLPTPAESAERGTLHQFGTLIQTDVRLALGASGGALVNLRGEMVGLTVALPDGAGAETAAGFAIPMDATFRRALQTLKEGREVEYGFLGIRPGNLAADEVRRGTRGVRVQSVVADSPAERHGLRVDDVLTAVAGRPLVDSDSLMLEVGRLPPETKAAFALVRNGRPMRLEVTLAKFPVAGPKVVTVPAASWRGLRVEFASAAAEALGDAGRSFPLGRGVVVVEVAPGSPAAKAGLQPGTMVSAVEGRRVRSPAEFLAAVERAGGAVDLQLWSAADGETTVRLRPVR